MARVADGVIADDPAVMGEPVIAVGVAVERAAPTNQSGQRYDCDECPSCSHGGCITRVVPRRESGPVAANAISARAMAGLVRACWAVECGDDKQPMACLATGG